MGRLKTGWLDAHGSMMMLWSAVHSLPARSQGPYGRAENALVQRFTSGDIDEEEFGRRMTLLRQHQESRCVKCHGLTVGRQRIDGGPQESDAAKETGT